VLDKLQPHFATQGERDGDNVEQLASLLKSIKSAKKIRAVAEQKKQSDNPENVHGTTGNPQTGDDTTARSSISHRKTQMMMTDDVSPKVSDEALEEMAELMEDEEGKRSLETKLRLFFHRVLSTSKFDAVMGIVIMANCIVIGIEVDCVARQAKPPSFTEVTEYLFQIIYTAEIGLRYYVYRGSAFNSAWVRFDLVLVVSAWISILGTLWGGEAGTGFVGVFKLLRVGKLVRPLRVISQYRPLWLLVRGLMRTAKTVVHAAALIFLFVYVFACLAVEVIAKDAHDSNDDSYKEHVEEFFPDLWTSCISLSNFIVLDSVAEMYSFMAKKRPHLVFLYYVPLIFILSISVMNLVLALIVEGSFDDSAGEKAQERELKSKHFKAQIKIIHQIFDELDTDKSGSITIEEIHNAPSEVKASLYSLVPTDDLIEIFLLLDRDHSGEVGIDEFCKEMEKIVTTDMPIETLRMKRDIHTTRSEVSKLTESMQEVKEMVATLNSLLRFKM
jgi:Ca2+-binding EF-hand superfamily protein